MTKDDGIRVAQSYHGSLCSLMIFIMTTLYAYQKLDVLIEKKDVDFLSATKQLVFDQNDKFTYEIGFTLQWLSPHSTPMKSRSLTQPIEPSSSTLMSGVSILMALFSYIENVCQVMVAQIKNLVKKMMTTHGKMTWRAKELLAFLKLSLSPRNTLRCTKRSFCVLTRIVWRYMETSIQIALANSMCSSSSVSVGLRMVVRQMTIF